MAVSLYKLDDAMRRHHISQNSHLLAELTALLKQAPGNSASLVLASFICYCISWRISLLQPEPDSPRWRHGVLDAFVKPQSAEATAACDWIASIQLSTCPRLVAMPEQTGCSIAPVVRAPHPLPGHPHDLVSLDDWLQLASPCTPQNDSFACTWVSNAAGGMLPLEGFFPVELRNWCQQGRLSHLSAAARFLLRFLYNSNQGLRRLRTTLGDILTPVDDAIKLEVESVMSRPCNIIAQPLHKDLTTRAVTLSSSHLLDNGGMQNHKLLSWAQPDVNVQTRLMASLVIQQQRPSRGLQKVPRVGAKYQVTSVCDKSAGSCSFEDDERVTFADDYVYSFPGHSSSNRSNLRFPDLSEAANTSFHKLRNQGLPSDSNAFVQQLLLSHHLDSLGRDAVTSNSLQPLSSMEHSASSSKSSDDITIGLIEAVPANSFSRKRSRSYGDVWEEQSQGKSLRCHSPPLSLPLPTKQARKAASENLYSVKYVHARRNVESRRGNAQNKHGRRVYERYEYQIEWWGWPQEKDWTWEPYGHFRHASDGWQQWSEQFVAALPLHCANN